MKLQLDLDFFAAFLQLPRNEVSYALLKVTKDDETKYHPVVAVSRYPRYVYDLATAHFIGINDETEADSTVEPATVRRSRRGVIFKSDVSGVEETYTTLDFYDTFKTMVANDYLR